MANCYALGCNHIAGRENCNFFRFPADSKLFEEWKSLCPRKYKEPTNEDHLCSCHFIDGEKVNLPTVFAQCDNRFEFSPTPEPIDNELTAVDAQDPNIVDDVNQWECRACLQKVDSDTGLIDLFQAWSTPWEGMENTIAADLAKIGNIELSSADKHSKFICDICYTKLHNACNFAAVVQQSDKVLRLRFPHEDLDPGNATVWPKPIQLDQNINGNVFDNTMDIEIKQEVLSDNDCETMHSNPETQYKDLASCVDIKIEPEEMMKPQPIQINGSFSYKDTTEHSVLPNGNEMLVEFLDAPLKEEPNSEVDSDSLGNDLPLECLLCAKSFHSVSGLKAHVIAQHSYKTVKRKTGELQSPPGKRERYICATCRRSFVTSTDLMVHETCHNKSVCYGCNQMFDTFEQLTRHRVQCKALTAKNVLKPKTLEDVKRIIAEEHKSTDDDDDLPKAQLQCHLCTEKFSDAYYMKIHQEIHHNTSEQSAPAPPPAAPAMETATLENLFCEDK